MATTNQMWINEQALRNAKWIRVEQATIGYCFIKGRKGFVFYHGRMQGVGVFHKVDSQFNFIGSNFILKPTDKIFVFSNKKNRRKIS